MWYDIRNTNNMSSLAAQDVRISHDMTSKSLVLLTYSSSTIYLLWRRTLLSRNNALQHNEVYGAIGNQFCNHDVTWEILRSLINFSPTSLHVYHLQHFLTTCVRKVDLRTSKTIIYQNVYQHILSFLPYIN